MVTDDRELRAIHAPGSQRDRGSRVRYHPKVGIAQRRSETSLRESIQNRAR
jgi:hypothetical protein